MKLVYPVDINHAIHEGSADHLKGATNQVGYYPIGRLNTWHGGIHIEGDHPIKAIADGILIAYRVCKEYPESSVTINGQTNTSYYSSSFVLIQHYYKSPKGQELSFYSLYQHLLPYSSLTEEKIPPFLAESSHRIKSTMKESLDKVVWGANERKSPNGDILRIVPANAEITILKSEGKWRQISHAGQKTTDAKGYVWANSIEAYKKCNLKTDQLDTINKCFIAVKAGDIIGHAGLYGFDKREKYQAAHIEVFTADDVTSFIKNNAKDGADKPNYLKFKKGTKLTKAYPYKIPKEHSIKVIEKGESFTRIQIHQIKATVQRDCLSKGIAPTSSQPKYTYTPKKLAELNTLFSGYLKSDSILVLEEDPNSLTGKTTRDVSLLIPQGVGTYWVKSSDPAIGSDAGAPFLPSSDITELYLTCPDADKLSETIEDEHLIIELNQCKKLTDSEQQKWLFVEVSDNGQTKSGYIKENDPGIKKVTVYNWEEFGFKLIDDPDDEYIYDCDHPIPFLNDVWNEIDTNGDNVLGALELFNAHKKPHVVRRLSRLVCKHTSEWAYSGDQLNSLVSKIDTMLQKGVDQEEDPERKDILQSLKQQRIDNMKDKVQKLGFWSELAGYQPRPSKNDNHETSASTRTAPCRIKDEGLLPDSINALLPDWLNHAGRAVLNWFDEPEKVDAPANNSSTTPKPEPKPLKPFPTNPKVYHFHPIAFVEQMRRMKQISKDEAKIRAYMRMLRVGEGTGELIKSNNKDNEVIYIPHDSEKGYTTTFGGYLLTDLTDHPKKDFGGSSAAGAYQVMKYTWEDENLSAKRKKYNITSFNQEAQDKFCLILMKYHPGCSEFINLIINGEIEKATRQCGSRIWASLPFEGDNSRYKFKGIPQPATPMKYVLEHFEKFYKDELDGKTNLHLKNGFLEEFERTM